MRTYLTVELGLLNVELGLLNVELGLWSEDFGDLFHSHTSFFLVAIRVVCYCHTSLILYPYKFHFIVIRVFSCSRANACVRQNLLFDRSSASNVMPCWRKPVAMAAPSSIGRDGFLRCNK